MTIDFYCEIASPSCRSVLMLGEILDIDFNLKPLNLREKEHLTPEFLKINPEHTIPTIVDNGFSVWESRAILIYLVEKYGKDSDLYPKDLKKRAKINQRLFFDAILGEKFHSYFAVMMSGKEESNSETLKKIENIVGFVDAALDGHKFVTGDKLTIADLALIVNLTTCMLLGIVDDSKFPNVNRWINDFKELPGYEINEKGLKENKKMLMAMRQKTEEK